MGSFAQDMANTRGYTREQMDDFAIRSLQRAQKQLLKVISKMKSFQ
jgi:acetyl-CoA C-acetyltransferase